MQTHWRYCLPGGIHTTECTLFVMIWLLIWNANDNECKQWHPHHKNTRCRRFFSLLFTLFTLQTEMFLHCNNYWVLFKCGCMSEQHDISMESHLEAMFTRNAIVLFSLNGERTHTHMKTAATHIHTPAQIGIQRRSFRCLFRFLFRIQFNEV